AQVYVVDRVPERLAKAKSIGCIPVDLSLGDPAEQIKKLRGGKEVDRGVDAVGYQAVTVDGKKEQPNAILEGLISVVRPCGGLGIPGLYVPKDPGAPDSNSAKGYITFPFGKLFEKGLTVGTGQCNVKTYNRYLRDLIIAGRAKPSFVVSHDVSLDEAVNAYDKFDKRIEGAHSRLPGRITSSFLRGNMDELDIRSDLEEILEHPDTDYKGAFSFHRTYSDAPNPGIKLTEQGVIGLPLSTLDAGAIKVRAARAPFGKGSQTLVDPTVRDTWEINGDSIAMMNPSWNQFLEQIVGEVCASLGVNVGISMPRAELYKLLLYEKGSHFKAHVDSEKANGMFATIVIVLPSAFTGGAAHLSHNGVPAIYDTAPTSQTCTTVLSWYTDVMHEIKPITSGYRLALSYNLLHTAFFLRPPLSPDTGFVGDLAFVLKAWSDDTSGTSPEKIIHMLEHRYSEANLSGRFFLGLASAKCRLLGEVEYNGGQFRGWGPDQFMEEPKREVTLSHFVDLEGKLISDDLEISEDESVPENLSEDVELRKWDDEDKGYLGNVAYLRTVLVIWPKRSNHEIIYKDLVGLKRACNDLLSNMSTSEDSASKHRDLAQSILSQCNLNPRWAADAVCQAAYTWSDVDLWNIAVRLCCKENGVATISTAQAVNAVEWFGWDKVEENLDLMLKHDHHNASRLDFLTALGHCSVERVAEDDEDKNELIDNEERRAAWVSARTKEVLGTLKVPHSSEAQALLDATKEYGGVQYLKDVMLPRLLPLSDSAFLLDFAHAVFAFKGFPDSPDKSSVVQIILFRAIDMATFFEHKVTPYRFSTDSESTGPLSVSKGKSAENINTITEKESTTAEKYVSACFALGCPSLVSSIIKRVMHVSREHAQECAKDVMLPLVTHCAELMGDKLDAASMLAFKELQQTGVKLYLDAICEGSIDLTKETFGKLLDATVLNGDPTMFVETVIPRLEPSTLDTDLKVVVEGVRDNRDRFVFPVDYAGRSLDSIIRSFAQKYAQNVSFTTAQSVIAALNWCVEVEHPDLCHTIIERLTSSQIMEKNFISDVLIPLLPDLRKWASERGPGHLDTLAPVFQNIVLAWFREVLGARPAPIPTLIAQLVSLRNWRCPQRCGYCPIVVRFLQEARPVRSLQVPHIGQPKRKHLEDVLLKHVQDAATFETITGRPQGLLVHKSEPLYQWRRWLAERQRGTDILNSLGTSESELRRLLGSDYDWIMATFRVNNPAPQACTDGHTNGLPSPEASVSSTQPTAGGSSTAGATDRRPEVEQRSAKKLKVIREGSRECIDLTSGQDTHFSPPYMDAVRPAVVAPSQLDIRDSLDKAFSDHTNDLKSAFSFNKSYSDAPNPGLKLPEDVGVVGLPLSTRDAAAIKGKAVQAPFGMGERTVVDTSVRDTWEIEGKLVAFLNPSWKQFVSRVLGEVCQTLGVNVHASMPRAELYKLLLYETGSHFLPHVDTEKADGMFATIIIVLPSAFTGGAAHLSHGALSTVYDAAPTSQLGTTVLAWYTDVQHEIKPITSGYRLALSYNLIHTTQSLRPALSANLELVEELADILQAWTDGNAKTNPDKIIYLLSHKYSQANLKGSALKGIDAHKVALLEVLSKKHGFSLGLANANCHLSGYAEDSGGGHRGWGYDDDDDDGDDDDVEFAEVEEREMSIQNFVDMEGKLIEDDLEYDDGETIPADLAETVESGECDEQDYEGYMGNGAGSLQRWYRRTVLVIWPNRHNCTILYQGEDGFERACDALISGMYTSKDKDLANFILSEYRMDPQQAADALCKAGYAWNDVELWKAAVKSCCKDLGVSTLDEEHAGKVLDQFPWQDVRECLELMLQHDQHNASRLEFLKHLEHWAIVKDGEDKDQPMATDEQVQGTLATAHEIHAWVSTQIQEVLKSLKAPQESESKALLDAARDNGGIQFLKNRMLPQILSQSRPAFLLHFASSLFSFQDLSDSSEKALMISTILKQAIANEIFFISKPPPPVGPYYRPTVAVRTVSQSATAEKYTSVCVTVGCPNRVSDIIDRITDISSLSVQQAQECAKDVMLPLVAYCAASIFPKPDLAKIHGFEKLRQLGISLYLDWVCANAGGLTKQEFEKVLNAVVLNGDPTAFLETVVPKLKSARLTDTALKAIVEGIREHRTRFVFPGGDTAPLEPVLLSFAERYALQTSLQTPISIISALNWSRDIQHAELCHKIIFRVLNPPTADKNYVSNVLVPFLPEFRKWADKTRALETYASVFSNIVLLWLLKVLGPRPAADPTLTTRVKGLERWSCTCHACQRARTFLQAWQSQQTLRLERIGAPTRRHLEGYLNTHARGLATYTTITGSPQGSMITKSQALHALSSWKTMQHKGNEILNSISPNDEELRRLLNPHYDEIITVIKGRAPAPQTAAPAPLHNPIAGVPTSASTTMASAANPHSMVSGSSAAAAGATQSGSEQPPTKKRKILQVDPEDIIDLT
ncbi:hypothetical protein EVG20_g2677, partial [Dentipellis fragilis]